MSRDPAENVPCKEAKGEKISMESIVNPRKLEHGFRIINAGIPYTLP